MLFKSAPRLSAIRADPSLVTSAGIRGTFFARLSCYLIPLVTRHSLVLCRFEVVEELFSRSLLGFRDRFPLIAQVLVELKFETILAFPFTTTVIFGFPFRLFLHWYVFSHEDISLSRLLLSVLSLVAFKRTTVSVAASTTSFASRNTLVTTAYVTSGLKPVCFRVLVRCQAGFAVTVPEKNR